MAGIALEAIRLLLRNFEETDADAPYILLKDTDVNTFFLWFPVKNIEEAKDFYKKGLESKQYHLAICQKEAGP